MTDPGIHSKYAGLRFKYKTVESGDIFIGRVDGSLHMAYAYASLFPTKESHPCYVLNKSDRSKVKDSMFL